MDDVRLDDAEQINAMKQRLECVLSTDLSLNAQIDSLVVSSLSYFEFVEVPRATTSGIVCRGYICCRYNHDTAIMNKLWSNYLHEVVFSVNGVPYSYSTCNNIRFMVSHWSDMVEINLDCRNQNSSISGFPEKVDHLVSLQEACNMMPSAGSKRKRPTDTGFHLQKRQRTKNVRTFRSGVKRL